MKKKAKKISIFSIIIKASIFVVGIVAICMAFLPFVTQTTYVVEKATSSYSLSGFIMAFGATGTYSKSSANIPDWVYFIDDVAISTKGITYTISSNTGALVTLILAMAATALTLITLFMTSKKSRKVAGIVLLLGGLCFLAAGVMAFFPLQFGSYETSFWATGTLKTGVEYTLGTGAILFAIFSLVGGLFSTVYGLFNATRK